MKKVSGKAADLKNPQPLEKPIYVSSPFLPPLNEFSEGLQEIWDNKWLTNNGPILQRFRGELALRFKTDNLCLFANGMLGIKFEYTILSEMDLEMESLNEPGDWALCISEKLGATEYINPLSAQDLFSAEEFAAHRITLTFQEFKPFIYDCKQWEFSPNLSIIDVLMWNSPDSILAYLNSGNSSR